MLTNDHPKAGMRRISVDIGGTFTDCFFAWDGKYIQSKALTTHHNLAQGFNEALDGACNQLGLGRREVLGGVDSVRYATTLGTNALIERKEIAEQENRAVNSTCSGLDSLSRHGAIIPVRRFSGNAKRGRLRGPAKR